MFKAIKRRYHDMLTIRELAVIAEKYANANGEKEPGAEHFLLAALDLPDGSARRAFARVHADPGQFNAAIDQQYQEALRNAGIELSPEILAARTATVAGTGFYVAQISAQQLMKNLFAERKNSADVPLSGAHVIVAATRAEQGVAVRALRTMGVDPVRLSEAATEEIGALNVR